MANEEPQKRVVIITALSLECLAICEHLENRRQTTHPPGTVYERGLFASEDNTAWDVLVVEAGAGNVTTAVEVERSISFFRPELALFVGVAGGLKDVRLGDVVVGTKVYAYESGKESEAFEARPESHVPSYRLAQRAKAEIRGGLWIKRIKGGIRNVAPKAFAGPIAAGEKVIASTSSATHQLLKERYPDALAVEMEGYGFLRGAYMNPQVAALVIRGISDLIDAKSSSDAGGSQKRAAEAASAFAFELLARLESQNLQVGDETDLADSARRVFRPDGHIDGLIQNVTLGNWKAAAQVAMRILETTDSSSGENDLFQALFRYQDCPDDDDRFWGALHTLESCVRLAPGLITRAQFSRMAEHKNFSVRAAAASICMDLAHSAPGHVPLDIALKLSVHDEDWYVQAPANAALKAMVRSFPEVLSIFFMRIHSRVPEERAHAASQIESVARREPHLLDEEQLSEEISRLKRLNDSESAELLQKALSKVRASPRREWYRYGL